MILILRPWTSPILYLPPVTTSVYKDFLLYVLYNTRRILNLRNITWELFLLCTFKKIKRAKRRSKTHERIEDFYSGALEKSSEKYLWEEKRIFGNAHLCLICLAGSVVREFLAQSDHGRGKGCSNLVSQDKVNTLLGICFDSSLKANIVKFRQSVFYLRYPRIFCLWVE